MEKSSGQEINIVISDMSLYPMSLYPMSLYPKFTVCLVLYLSDFVVQEKLEDELKSERRKLHRDVSRCFCLLLCSVRFLFY